MKALFFLFLSILTTYGAVTDVVIPQRDTSTSFTQRTITGSSNVGKGLAFDGSGVLTATAFQALDTDLTSWAGVTRAANYDTFAATPSSANFLSLLTTKTGTGLAVFGTSPTLTTPNLGTPSAINLLNAVGLPLGSIDGLGTSVATALALNVGSAGAFVVFNGAGGTPSSINLSNASSLPLTAITGLGSGIPAALAINTGSAGAPVLFNGAGGTPSSLTLTNGTGLPIAGLTGLGTGIPTFLATPSSANLASAITDETGSGVLVFGTSPVFTTNITLPSAAAPTTSSVAQMAFDNNAWASAHGAVAVHNGTAVTWLVGVEASDTPSEGQVPTWNTGGTITWETPSAGGGGTGDVSAASNFGTDNVLIKSDGTSKGVQATGISVDDSNNITGVTAITTTGLNTSSIEFEGATADANETTLTVIDPTADRTATLPDADTKIPVFAQTITFAGPTAARTVTLPDSNFTAARTDAANTFTGTQTIGALAVTTVNGNTITAGSGTLTLNGAKTLTINNSVAFTGTDGSTITFGAGGTILYNGGALGTPSSGTLTNATGLPIAGVTGWGTGVAAALGTNVGSAGAPVLFNGALGTPSSGTVTNLTGTASININGTVGATTPTTGAFTTGVFGSATSLLLGTAGSAVGSVGFRNATSGTVTVAPPTGALGTFQVTLPNAASTLPIYGQQITYSGPTAARTVTYPDASFTVARTDAANSFTGIQTMTNLAITPATTTYGATTTIDFSANSLTTVSLTGNVTFATSNLAAGRSVTVQIVCDATPRTLAFPATWKFVGAAAPSSLAASKIAILTLTSFSTTDANVRAAYSAEP